MSIELNFGSQGPGAIELVVGFLSALATTAAAVFAAVSARASQQSADRAGEAVAEARASRRSAIIPQFTLVRNFSVAEFLWSAGRPAGAPMEFVSNVPQLGCSFHLVNHSQGAALEPVVTFELLSAPSGDLTMNRDLTRFGIHGFRPGGHSDVVEQMPQLIDFGGTGLPLYRLWREDRAYLNRDERWQVMMPWHLMFRLLAVEVSDQRPSSPKPYPDCVLAIDVSCHTVDGEQVHRRFEFDIVTTVVLTESPLITPQFLCNISIHERPLLPKPPGPRVA